MSPWQVITICTILLRRAAQICPPICLRLRGTVSQFLHSHNPFKIPACGGLFSPYGKSFWSEVAKDIFWYKKPSKILNSDNPPFYKWFEDGVTNTCYNAVDLHVKNGMGKKTAIIYDSPITNSKEKITDNQLKDRVSIFAGALKKQSINN